MIVFLSIPIALAIFGLAFFLWSLVNLIRFTNGACGVMDWLVPGVIAMIMGAMIVSVVLSNVPPKTIHPPVSGRVLEFPESVSTDRLNDLQRKSEHRHHQ